MPAVSTPGMSSTAVDVTSRRTASNVRSRASVLANSAIRVAMSWFGGEVTSVTFPVDGAPNVR
jgi:hypothetical protein